MTHIEAGFGAGTPISSVPSSWFNAVANFLNNLAPGRGIRFNKHFDGNATIIEATSGFTSSPSDGAVVLADGTDGGLKSVTPISTGTNAVDVVTNVSWDGSQINISGKTLTFTNGVLTAAEDKQYTPITTVTYNP